MWPPTQCMVLCHPDNATGTGQDARPSTCRFALQPLSSWRKRFSGSCLRVFVKPRWGRLIAMTHPYRRWTFLASHARVLLVTSRDPDVRLRTIAAACRITERAVQTIIVDLEQCGYLHRVGRRNQYILQLDQPLRHPGSPARALSPANDQGDAAGISEAPGAPDRTVADRVHRPYGHAVGTALADG